MVRRLAVFLSMLGALGACGSSSQCDEAVGHDEDNDGRDDGCDPCPFADDNDADADGDGIAGVCDPDPMKANTLLKFTGFGGEDSELTLTGGAIEGDAFHVAGGSKAGSALWGSGLDQVWVVAGVTVDAIDPTGFREVGVVFDATAVPAAMLPNGTYCVVGERDIPEPGTDYIEVLIKQQPASDEILVTDQAVLYLSGLKQATIQAYHSLAATPSSSCAFGVPGNRALISGTRTPPPAAAKAGVVGFAVDVKFSFMFVLGE
jgi:hypothetical protein